MRDKNKNNKRFVIADKMYFYTVGSGGQVQYAYHDFNSPRFTIYDLQK
jgi:hypothetical protein